MRLRFWPTRFWPTFLTSVMLVTLIGLGTWQMQRLAWKQQLLAAMEQNLHLPPLDVGQALPAEAINFRPAMATGVFQFAHEFYLYALSSTGQGGYHVLTPLQLANGRLLMIDRGWIPYAKKPQSATDDTFFRPPGLVTIKGILRLPQAPSWVQPRNDPIKGDWYYVDLPAMQAAAALPAMLPYILDADAVANPGGYPIGGQTRVELPNHHLQYAITWYGLAAALAIIYGMTLRRRNGAD